MQRARHERFQFGMKAQRLQIHSGTSNSIYLSSLIHPRGYQYSSQWLEPTRRLYFTWIRASYSSVAGLPMSHAVQPFKRTSTANKNVDDDDARPYVIVEDIGKGSFATVYKGYHEVHTFNAQGCVAFD